MFRMICLTTSAIFALSACGGGDDPAPAEPDASTEMEKAEGHQHMPLPAPAAGEDARGVFIGTDGEETGEAIVTGGPNGMLIRVSVSGIEHGFHGVHLHQVGDCSDHAAGFKASGDHINPGQTEHGLMNVAGYELADLPNIYAHHSGTARAELFAGGLMLEQALDDDGFALVVHANPDDHMTQPIGGAGARVACAAFN